MPDSPPEGVAGTPKPVPSKAELDELMAQAEAAHREGRLGDAEELGRKVLSLRPDRVDALVLLATLARARRQPMLAVEIFRQALVVQPDTVEVMAALGNVLRETGQLEQAIGVCQEVIRLRPEDAGGHNRLGLCYLTVQRPVEALACFERAIELAPEMATYHENLGIGYEQMGRFDEATKCFVRAISLAPKSARIQIRLGALKLMMGDRKGAITSARLALAVEPNSADGHILLARALSDDHKFDEAEGHLRKAIEGDPRAHVAHTMLGTRLQQKGQFDEAAAELELAIALQPKQGAAYFALVRGRTATEGDRPFIGRMEALLQQGLPPAEAQYLHYALGKGYNDLEEYQQAMRHYDEANRISAEMFGQNFDPAAYEAMIDGAVQLFSKEFMDGHQNLGSESELPIFIVGMIRSGTTLVEQILTSHPQIGPGGEVPFWQEEGMAALAKLAQDKLDANAASELADDYRRLLRSSAPKKMRVTDKMPTNYMVLGLIHLVFPRAKILYCHRNPVDNCLSIYETRYAAPPLYAFDKANIVFAYEQHLRLMSHWKKVLPPGSILDVGYEHLIEHREKVTRQMIEFCGVEWDDACLHHEANKNAIVTPSMWQARQPVYSKSVGQWKHYEPWLGEFGKLK